MGLLWRRRQELHPDQVAAIEGLSVDGRYLLAGPPGSGKTSILLHRGEYLRRPPYNMTNVQLVTFTRTLREFIAVNGDDRFPPGLIKTVRELMTDVFKAYHAPFPDFDESITLAEKNRELAKLANQLIESQGRRLEFDCLLVDEIQDLSAEEIVLFGTLSQRNMFVGDSRQKLFDAQGAFEAAKALECQDIELRHHFRISRDICRVADSILRQADYRLEQFSHYQGPAPSPPLATGGLSKPEQINKLLEALDVQLDTYNDPEDLIGVITWRKKDCDYISEELRKTRFGPIARIFHSSVDGRRFDPGARICIVTAQSCKGLEFRALHWLFADERPGLITRERAYAVVTRAKTSLNAYHHGPLPTVLAGSIPVAARGMFDDDDDDR